MGGTVNAGRTAEEGPPFAFERQAGAAQAQYVLPRDQADQLAPQTATEFVNRLVAAGLADRITDPEDRRRQGLLTSKADRLMKSLSIAHLHKLRQMAPTLIEILKAFGI